MSAQGNQHQKRGNPGPIRRPQRQMSPRRGISNGSRRRGSSSPPLNRSFSHHERYGRHNSDFVPRTRAPRTRMPVPTSFAPTPSPSSLRMQPRSQQRQISNGSKRRVIRGLAPTYALESQALVVRDQSPSTEDVSMASPLALVPTVEPEPQSSQHKQAPRQSSVSSESTGVWIDCPKQNDDPCEDDLTFSECQGLRDEDSYATYDATHGSQTTGPTSVAHSFATYEVLNGQGNLRRWTKPSRKNQGSNQTRSKAADLVVMSEIAEDSITSSKGKYTARLTEDCEEANERELILSYAAQTLGERGIARKATNGSLPSRDKKQSFPFVPGPPPKKPTNLSLSVSGPARPKSPELVRTNTSSAGNSGVYIGSNGPANHQKAPDNHVAIAPARSSDSPIETLQPVTSTRPYLFEGPSENNWQHYLTRGYRNNSNCRGSSRTNTPERRDPSWGRTSSTGRSVASRERSLSAGRAGERLNKMFGRAPEKLENNDRQVKNVVNDMPCTDQFGDFGFYTGQVNENGRPDGNGSMKYDNGIFYEGTWTDGCQDEKAAMQYQRVRSGFTSWKGKGKAAARGGMVMPWNARNNDKHDENDKTYVRGMEWVDLNGDSGKYTGDVNKDELPHGEGIMKYDFGLIAEGGWVNGMLKENPLDRVLSAQALSSSDQSANAMPIVCSARSLHDSSLICNTRSLGTTDHGGSLHSWLGNSLMGASGGFPPMAMQMHPMMMMMMQSQQPPPMMMMPQPNRSTLLSALVTQQNAMMMQAMQAGAIYGGPPMAQMHPPPPQQQQQNAKQVSPPIAEIKFS